jgi:hypothetical protein
MDSLFAPPGDFPDTERRFVRRGADVVLLIIPFLA